MHEVGHYPFSVSDSFSGLGDLQFGIGNHLTFEGATGYKNISLFSPELIGIMDRHNVGAVIGNFFVKSFSNRKLPFLFAT